MHGEMMIYIPTLGRADRQRTFKNLPKRWQARVWYVIHERERELFKWHPRRIVVDKIGVCHFRQAALEHATRKGYEKMFMFDDDLTFNVRASNWTESTPHLMVPNSNDIDDALTAIEKRLDMVAAAGFDARFGNNRRPKGPWIEAARMMYAFGVDVQLVNDIGARFDKFFFWEDFHMALELLKHGYPNSIYLNFVVGSATNSKGGVSLYRTPEKLREVHAEFVKYHAPWVKAVDKTSKSWGGGIGDTVPDIRVAWKKCYLHGCKGGL